MCQSSVAALPPRGFRVLTQPVEKADSPPRSPAKPDKGKIVRQDSGLADGNAGEADPSVTGNKGKGVRKDAAPGAGEEGVAGPSRVAGDLRDGDGGSDSDATLVADDGEIAHRRATALADVENPGRFDPAIALLCVLAGDQAQLRRRVASPAAIAMRNNHNGINALGSPAEGLSGDTPPPPTIDGSRQPPVIQEPAAAGGIQGLGAPGPGAQGAVDGIDTGVEPADDNHDDIDIKQLQLPEGDADVSITVE
ncbi:hypothetical protein CC86DRAFT_456036 [Ophiobolus disseminans]|uniref:Uncharacterized protein n=1 Tax=Ophiobolus disseminans TaxID=1469910 RepID=A0A6A6ZZ13_9PLEO|nr:hypothetical protein CC86DRAFT_456036 [Ophiobolus disseminans]